jgi:hypothetical protein
LLQLVQKRFATLGDTSKCDNAVFPCLN